MGWVSGIVVYLLTWWIVIFMVLPWGLERDADGTPRNPHLKKKIIITTGISALIWLAFYFLIGSDISFREMALEMGESS